MSSSKCLAILYLPMTLPTRTPIVSLPLRASALALRRAGNGSEQRFGGL